MNAISDLPVGCSWCRAVRLDGTWTPAYSPLFVWARSHGICPRCVDIQMQPYNPPDDFEHLYADIGGEG